MHPDGLLPVVISSDSFAPGISHESIGCGFKLNIEKGESPLKNRVFKTAGRLVPYPWGSTDCFSEVMDSKDKMEKHLQISGHLSISYGPMISGEGAGKYLKDSVNTSRQSAFWYRARHIHSYIEVQADPETGRLLPVDDVAQSLTDFTFDYDKYGTKYISQMIYGAQLDVKFTVTSEEMDDLSELMAELKGSIGVGPLSVAFQAKYEQKESDSKSKYHMEIKVKASGISISVPPNPSLEQTMEIVNQFNDKYKELTNEEDKVVKDGKMHRYLSPIAFVVADIKDQAPHRDPMQAQLFEGRMAQVAKVFINASHWIAKLSAAQKQIEIMYPTPKERETLTRVHTKQVNEEIEKLETKQEECVEYRGKSLNNLLQGAPPPEAYPVRGSFDENALEGLVGNGFIKSPKKPEGIEKYYYEGFTVRDPDVKDDKQLIPCLSGRLLSDSQVVACGRTPYELALKLSIDSHELDPAFLQTNIMSDNSFNSKHGDLFVPTDMRPILDKRVGVGTSTRLLGPVFKNKRMVLMGNLGTGKTLFFNRVTGSEQRSSGDLQSVTTTLSMANARGPAADLLVVDTPGIDNADGMGIDEAMELRKGLVTGTVAQIVIFSAFSNITRVESLKSTLSSAITNLMDCPTFQNDANGIPVRLERSSPRRVRPVVVFTHRDKAAIGRDKFQTAIEKLRETFSWIGPVAFIDPQVSLTWLYDTIIALAGYEMECCTNHSIPLVDMFTYFSLRFIEPKDEWVDYIQHGEDRMIKGKEVVQKVAKTVVKEREDLGKVGSGDHEDFVASTLDMLIRFIDDLTHEVILDTLAKCYDTDTHQLWCEKDEARLNEMVNVMNWLRRKYSQHVRAMRKEVRTLYPTTGEAAVYKACNHCGQVFVKPTGCNFIGLCGSGGVAKDENHGGDLNKRFGYEYDENTNNLQVRKDGRTGKLEQSAWTFRRCLNELQKHLPVFEADFEYKEVPESKLEAFKGCGNDLHWDTMRTLSTEALRKMDLVPRDGDNDTRFMPVSGSGSMPIKSFLRCCGTEYETYDTGFIEAKIQQLADLIETVNSLNEIEFNVFVSTIVKSQKHRVNIIKELKRYV